MKRLTEKQALNECALALHWLVESSGTDVVAPDALAWAAARTAIKKLNAAREEVAKKKRARDAHNRRQNDANESGRTAEPPAPSMQVLATMQEKEQRIEDRGKGTEERESHVPRS